MIKRYSQSKLNYFIDNYPAVALLGPRQAGKTTLALTVTEHRNAIYLDLESERDRAKLSQAELYLAQHEDKLVILDEVQRAPELFQNLRGLIDQGRRKGLRSARFLLLGSASIELLKQSSETLAGRIAYLELPPLHALEVMNIPHKDQLWTRGGFPDSLLATNDQISFQWRLDFIRTYLERDLPQLGPRIPAETLRRFWVMLAHNQSELLNAAKLASALGIDGKTVAKYLDLMVDLLLVRRLKPWHENTKKRLVKSPKVYIRDSGLTHALLGIQTQDDLLGHPICGSSWEGYIIENIVNLAPQNTEAYFYRSSGGSECDLILKLPDQKIWAIEIKRSLSPKVEKGFYYACDDIQANNRYVIYPGEETYPLAHDTEAINLNHLLKKLNTLAPSF
jgi:predicted AAA+ superfamily ATPase